MNTPTCLLLTVCILSGACTQSSSDPVILEETDQVYILDNGIVRAQVAKVSGDIVSLRYQGHEMFATFLTANGEPDLQRDPPGENLEGLNRGMTDHQYGFWSHDAMGKRGSGEAIVKVTVDPSDNKPLVVFATGSSGVDLGEAQVTKWSSGTTWVDLGYVNTTVTHYVSIAIDPTGSRKGEGAIDERSVHRLDAKGLALPLRMRARWIPRRPTMTSSLAPSSSTSSHARATACCSGDVALMGWAARSFTGGR